MLTSLYQRHVLSASQFTIEEMDHLFQVTRAMRTLVDDHGGSDMLHRRVMARLFYEPSTRTAMSFGAAMSRLGGTVIPTDGVQYSSVSKGETLADTVRTVQEFSDIVVLRHFEEGAALEASQYLRIPLINAGDGIGEHPTQALLDMYTIQESFSGFDGLTITVLGDLLNGRTVHALLQLLAMYKVTINLVAPPVLRLPTKFMEILKAKGVTFHEHEDLSDCLAETDVLYVTRVQKERFATPEAYAAVAGSYVITSEVLQGAKPTMIVMHPFPRVNEIHPDVDHDPRAAYFRQIRNGMTVRMAILACVFGKM